MCLSEVGALSRTHTLPPCARALRARAPMVAPAPSAPAPSSFSSSSGPRHAEAGHGDDLALHFVGTAAEGQDRRVAAIEAFAASVKDGVRAAVADGARGSQHFEQELVGGHVELAAEDLHDRG